MSRRISKKTRALAIQALEFACSDVEWYSSQFQHVRNHIDGDALELAESAFSETLLPIRVPGLDHFREELMEAAGLLRDGWCPGDEVVVLCRCSGYTSGSPS